MDETTYPRLRRSWCVGRFFWTVVQGYRTLRQQSATLQHQAETQEASRIAGLLSLLSEQEEEKRLGAARGLSRYADKAITEILSAIGDEKVPSVRSALEDALVGVTDQHIASVFISNQGTLPERAYLQGRLVGAGATSAFSGAILRLSPFAAATIRKNYRGKFDQGTRLQHYETRRAAEIQRSVSDANLRLVHTCEQAALLAEGTGQVIARLVKANRIPEGSKYSLDLTSTDLYGANLSNVRLRARFKTCQSSLTLQALTRQLRAPIG